MIKKYKQTLEIIKPYILLLVLVGGMGFVILTAGGAGSKSSSPSLEGDKSTTNAPQGEASGGQPAAEETQQGNGTGSGQSSSTKCRTEEIPYRTVEKEAIWLYVGESKVEKGYLGKKKICVDSQGKTTETVTTKPLDSIVYRGTKQRVAPPSESQSYSYEEAYQLSRRACEKRIPAGSWDSTNMRDCVIGEMSRYGY
jgi:hypothetical protein